MPAHRKIAADASKACGGRAGRLHWSKPDPVRTNGADAEILAAFDEASAMLKSRVDALIA